MKHNRLTPVKKETKRIREAKIVLQRCLQILKRRFVFFRHALMIFEPVAVEESIEMATNGKYLYFHAEQVQHIYKTYGMQRLNHSILHMMFHGIFGDFEVEEEKKWMPLRWAVMDLKIDRMLRLFGYEEEPWFGNEILYHAGLYMEGRKNKEKRLRIEQEGDYVRTDDHVYWAKEKKSQNETGSQTEAGFEQEPEYGEKEWKQVREKMFPGKLSVTGDKENGLLLEQVLHGMIKKGYGIGEGTMRWMEHAAKGKANDYKMVLKKILSNAEIVKEEDTIDPALYLYGLECYGDVALIEPLELSEQKMMNTIVIAVDTSGSCIEAVPLFLRETVGIIRNMDEMIKQGKLWYMECDTRVTAELSFEKFSLAAQTLSSRVVQGGGGTNFNPVFERIQELREQGEKIDALFYLSDADGAFPEYIPEYPVYFVLERGKTDLYLPQMPEWVNVVWL